MARGAGLMVFFTTRTLIASVLRNITRGKRSIPNPDEIGSLHERQTCYVYGPVNTTNRISNWGKFHLLEA